MAARRRRWWLARQAEQEATLVGVLADLVDTGTPVALSVAGGRRHLGRLWAVGPTVVGLRTAQGIDVVVVLGAVSAVAPAPRGSGRAPSPPVGDRPRPRAAGDGLVAVLGPVAGDRRLVATVDVDGGRTEGELAWVGTDVALLDCPTGPVYVALDLLAEVAVLDR